MKLSDKGHEEKAEAVNAAAVKIARNACPDGKFVAKSRVDAIAK